MATKILSVLLLSLVTACGGGGVSEPASTAAVAAAPAPTPGLLVIGNSLTRHPPMPERGWFGDWGMAATNQANDFAHITGVGLGLPVDARHFAAIETAPGTNMGMVSQVSVTPVTVAVLELGDNVVDVEAFRPAYVKLLDAMKGAKRLVCLSTWWGGAAKDAMMKAECTARGGRWVDIGDIYPLGLDPLEFADGVIQDHPHDASMRVIAARVLDAAR